MIIIKLNEPQKKKEFDSLFKGTEKTYQLTIENNKITFDTEDSTIIDYINSNFTDYVDIWTEINKIKADINSMK